MKSHSSLLLPLVVALAAACGSTSEKAGASSAASAAAAKKAPPPPTTLGDAGWAPPDRTMLVGTALEYGALVNDPTYAAVAAREFNFVTPGNETKWGSLQSVPGVWNFDQADAIYAFAESNHMKVKGHTLVWHQQLPPFVNDSISAADLDQALADHINAVVGRYAGRTYSWDVVNEAVADDGSGLRNTIFLQKLGPDYIDTAFRRAHDADPHAALYYNDYGADSINAKSDAILALVTDLLARGTPIDGVGFQMHLEAQNAPTKDQMKANFERFTALGLQVNISELDVRVTKVPGSLSRKLAFEKEIYNRVAAACAETKHCRAVTSWGFTDAYSWIHTTFGPDWPLQFDGNYQKKPAYDGELLGLQDQLVPSAGDVYNLVANPSFESSLDGWTSWGGTFSLSSAAAHQGAQSAVLTGRTASWQGPVYPLTSLVQTGYNYTGSAWAQIATTDPVTLSAKIVCDGNTQYTNLASLAGVPGQWIYLSGNLSVPQCTTLSELDLYLSGPPAGVDIMVDDVFVGNESSAYGKNLVGNSNFESGVSGWSTWGATISASTLQAHGGTTSALVTNRTATYLGPVYWMGTLMSPGKKYAVSAWARLGSGANQQVNFTAQMTCNGAASYSQMASAQASSSGWTQLTGTFTVPNCASNYSGINVYLEGPSAGTDLFVDDVSVQEVVITNLIANPGFEMGVAGWSTWGAAISASPLHPHTGAQCGVVTKRTATYQGAVYDLTKLVAQGTTYNASIWTMLGAGAADQQVDITAQIICDGVTTYNRIGQTTANSSTWSQISGTFKVPTCTTLSAVNFYAEGPAGGVDLFVDDAVVR
jgi:GH35 family endo-1,4-beta-xylanase